MIFPLPRTAENPKPARKSAAPVCVQGSRPFPVWVVYGHTSRVGPARYYSKARHSLYVEIRINPPGIFVEIKVQRGKKKAERKDG